MHSFDTGADDSAATPGDGRTDSLHGDGSHNGQFRNPADADSLLEAGLDLIGREGWRDFSLAALAREAGVPLADLYAADFDRVGLLKAFLRRLDREALSEAGSDPGGMESETPRDRLFDAVMLRFEAAEPYRAAIRVLYKDLRRDPLTLGALMPDMRRTLAWIYESAGMSPKGLQGAVRIRVLGTICLQTLPVWLDDDGRDLARTMADLDRRLRRSARWLGLESRGGHDRSASSSHDARSHGAPSQGDGAHGAESSWTQGQDPGNAGGPEDRMAGAV